MGNHLSLKMWYIKSGKQAKPSIFRLETGNSNPDRQHFKEILTATSWPDKRNSQATQLYILEFRSGAGGVFYCIALLINKTRGNSKKEKEAKILWAELPCLLLLMTLVTNEGAEGCCCWVVSISLDFAQARSKMPGRMLGFSQMISVHNWLSSGSERQKSIP